LLLRVVMNNNTDGGKIAGIADIAVIADIGNRKTLSSNPQPLPAPLLLHRP
jgi:hypothetical protein